MTNRLVAASAGAKGLGVFARERIEEGEVIEVCHVLVEASANIADGSNLDRYVYQWGDDDHCAVALGYGSLYNHSFGPNAVFTVDEAAGTITFRARRPIERGDEVTINYNGDPSCMDPVDFECVDGGV